MEQAIHNISHKILIFYQNASGNKHLKDNDICYCYDIYNLKMVLINILNDLVKTGVFSMLHHHAKKWVVFGIILASGDN